MAGRQISFNDRAVAGARYIGTGKEVEYRLAGHRGLVLVVQRPKQDKSVTRIWRFHYTIRVDAKQIKRRVHIGTYPAISLAEAASKAAGYRVRTERGEDVLAADAQSEARLAAEKLTFADLLVEYLAARQGMVRLNEVRRELEKDALPVLGKMRPAEITTADIDGVGERIFARNPEAATVAYRVAMHLKAMFNFMLLDRPKLAAKYGVTSNPAAKLGRKRQGLSKGRERGYAKPAPRDNHLLDDGIVRWWSALQRSGASDSTKIALQLILITAQRPGEVRRARTSDLYLDADEPYWLIPREHSKNGKEHFVPLSSLAVSMFRRAEELSPSRKLIFPAPQNEDIPISNVVLPTAQASLFRIHLEDMSPVTAHDLRRTAATGMRRLGVDRDVVSLILSHKARDVTGRHYDHHDAKAERRDALSLWANHLLRLTAYCGHHATNNARPAVVKPPVKQKMSLSKDDC